MFFEQKSYNRQETLDDLEPVLEPEVKEQIRDSKVKHPRLKRALEVYENMQNSCVFEGDIFYE